MNIRFQRYCALPEGRYVEACSRFGILFLAILLSGSCQEAEPPKAAAKMAGPLNAIIETDHGRCVIELAQEAAPRLSANFANLVEKKFFDGLAFYRSSTVMRQAGNPYASAERHYNPGYRLLPEFSPALTFNDPGVVAMPLLRDDNMSDVRQTEFFITVKPQDRWTFKFPIFARVVDGLDVVRALQDGDIIHSIRLQGDPTALMQRNAQHIDTWNRAMDANPAPRVP